MTFHEQGDFFPAPDGLQLFQRRWRPQGGPRAEVLLVHGFIEHGGRYAPTAEALVRCGVAVSAWTSAGMASRKAHDAGSVRSMNISTISTVSTIVSSAGRKEDRCSCWGTAWAD